MWVSPLPFCFCHWAARISPHSRGQQPITFQSASVFRNFSCRYLGYELSQTHRAWACRSDANAPKPCSHIRVMWEAVCSRGWGDCWLAALSPCTGRGNGGEMLMAGWQDPTQPASWAPQETRSMHLEVDGCLQGGWREGKEPPLPSALSRMSLEPGVRCCRGGGAYMYTKPHKVLPSVLGVGPSQVEQEGADATKALICAGAVGQESIRQPQHWKAYGGFPPWGCPATVPAPRGVFPWVISTEAKPHRQHHTSAFPTALMGGKEPPEHLASGQGWFSLVLFICFRSSGVTDGSVYCVAVVSPASFTLIPAWQHRTIPPIHKTLGFLLFPLTFGFWMILIYAHERLSDLVKNNTVAWGHGQGGKAIFLFVPILSQAGCERCSAVNDEVLRLPGHSAYPTKGNKAHLLAKSNIFFVSERLMAPAKHWVFEAGVQGKVKCMQQ